MDKCCRTCKHYNYKNGYCDKDIFSLEETTTETDIRYMDLIDKSDYCEVENISFKVKNPREFSCCCWE